MRINIQASGIEKVRAMLQRIGTESSTQALAQTVVQVEDYVRAEAGKHQKTGALNSSIFKHRNADGSWDVGHDLKRAPHALFVVWGTKPHLIRPKNKKMLRWASGGAFHFAKVVHHPGNKPDNWVARAATLAPQMFEQHVRQHIAKLNQG
jgi:hypothetical protein